MIKADRVQSDALLAREHSHLLHSLPAPTARLRWKIWAIANGVSSRCAYTGSFAKFVIADFVVRNCSSFAQSGIRASEYRTLQCLESVCLAFELAVAPKLNDCVSDYVNVEHQPETVQPALALST